MGTYANAILPAFKFLLISPSRFVVARVGIRRREAEARWKPALVKWLRWRNKIERERGFKSVS